MAQLEPIEAIEKRLWKAAAMLRANSAYAGNANFLSVILIFLPNAYRRFLNVKAAIEADLPKRGGKTRALITWRVLSEAPVDRCTSTNGLVGF